MTDESDAIDHVRYNLAKVRDARRGDKELYDVLTFCIGDLYHTQENVKAAERLAKIEVLEELATRLVGGANYALTMATAGCMIAELRSLDKGIPS